MLLDSVFIKTANEMFAWYRFATTRQKPGQCLDEYWQELLPLSKDCNFRDVSKSKHHDGFIRENEKKKKSEMVPTTNSIMTHRQLGC